MAIGAARATPSATSSARPTTSSATSLTSPQASASSAATTRPVYSISRARGIPTASGSSQLTAIPPCVPSCVNGALNVADGDAYRRSQASARHSPAPTAGPLTAATTGTGICCGASQAR